jgi:hypothetical protein
MASVTSFVQAGHRATSVPPQRVGRRRTRLGRPREGCPP